MNKYTDLKLRQPGNIFLSGFVCWFSPPPETKGEIKESNNGESNIRNCVEGRRRKEGVGGKKGGKNETAGRRRRSHPSESRSKTKERWMNANPTESKVNTSGKKKK